MNYEQIEEVVRVLRDTPRLTEIELRHAPEGATPVTLRLRRPPAGERRGSGAGGALSGGAAGAGGRSSGANGAGAAGNGNGAPAADGGAAAAAAAQHALPDQVLVTAGLVGIFHLPAPDKRFNAGDPVQNGQVLGRIESMRLLTDCLANADGILTEVLVQDGQPVEYGQALFEIRPQEGSDE